MVYSACSGSVGGLTYSRNKYGPYTRTRAMPVNPASQYQNGVRSFLATCVSTWTTILTVNERSAWETWAMNTPQQGPLGETIIISGQNAFVKMNTFRMQMGLTIGIQAPIIFANAVLTPPTIATATASTEVLSIVFTNTDLWASATAGKLAVYTSRPQNASKMFFAGPYRFAGFISGAATPPTSPLPITAAFPFAVGQRVHCRFRAVNPDARISTPWRISALGV